MRKIFLLLMICCTGYGQTIDDAICDTLGFSAACEDEAMDVLSQSNFANEILDIYMRNSCRPIWIKDNTSNLEQLLFQLTSTNDHGISGNRYNIDALFNRLDLLGSDDPEKEVQALMNELALLDIQLMETAFQLASDYRYGTINPFQQPFTYEIAMDSMQLVEAFLRVEKEGNVSQFYNELHSQMSVYKRLQTEYRLLLQRKNKDTVIIPDFSSLCRPNEVHPLLPNVREKLSQYFIMYDYNNDVRPIPFPNDSTLITSTDTIQFVWKATMDSFLNRQFYDTVLLDYVKEYQRLHGLNPDGVIGPGTVTALNMTTEKRMISVALSMEQLRWLPRQLEDRYVTVNLASYSLNYIDSGMIQHQQRVVVGAPWFSTPVFDHRIRYIEFNPYWNVPYSISTKEILPKLKKNPAYLAQHKMELMSGSKVVNPNNIDWNTITRSNFRYTIRQVPGSHNALGQVKFLFPNQYSIYLHDTQAKKLFLNAERAASHGCIRLHEPMELSYILLGKDKGWDQEKIDGILNKRKSKRYELNESVPVFLYYHSVDVNDLGEIIYHADVYGRESILVPQL